MKKLFVCILFLMLLLPVVSFSTAINENNTIYVDAGGGADFTRIQDAIDNASDGDTVFVYSGFYQENLIVNKSIILQGEDKETTIIDGDFQSWPHGDNVVSVDANQVTINGFTIQNGGRGIRVSSSSDSIIRGNIITNNHVHGIWLYTSSDSIITGNTIANNSWVGIRVSHSSNLLINNNVFNSNGIIIEGFHLERWNSHIIENNSANGRPIRYYKNAEDIVVPSDTSQVILANCTGFTIQDLNLSDGDRGIQLGFSSDTTINGNTIINNNWDGIILWSSSDNTITGNIIINNLNHGIKIQHYSSDNTITGNTISNTCFGILLLDSSDNTITGNIIKDNKIGMRLYSSSNTNVVSGNTITNNNYYGIWLYFSKDNTINKNNFIGNDRDAFFTTIIGVSTSNHWSGNYWDDWQIGSTRPIHGEIFLFPRRHLNTHTTFPWLNFDWNPANEPYEIDGGLL